MIKHQPTFAEILQHDLLREGEARGIYHAEPNIITGTLLIKYHPALNTEQEVIERLLRVVKNISIGNIEISAKHKNTRLGKMHPGAFFTRELVVSIVGNLIAGLILAAVLAA